MSRGLASLATAAVTGTAFAAAVTLPTLVTLGSDTPPESLALPQSATRTPTTVVQAAPLALTVVQLIVRNSLRHHTLRVDATPPADWGDRFT